MKNKRLVEALEDLKDKKIKVAWSARLARSVCSARSVWSAYCSARSARSVWSSYRSDYYSAKLDKPKVLEIIKNKLIREN